MEERLPLYENDRPVGTLLRREEGLHCLFAAECSGGEGLRKVWLCTQGGARLLLGTLAPEGDRWRLSRRLAASELRRQGFGGPVWGEIRPGDWLPQEGERPPVVFRDPVIAQAARRWNRGRWRRSGNLWRLSYPWQVGQQVPLEPLFCFARAEGGELYYLLDGEGFPNCGYDSGEGGTY